MSELQRNESGLFQATTAHIEYRDSPVPVTLSVTPDNRPSLQELRNKPLRRAAPPVHPHPSHPHAISTTGSPNTTKTGSLSKIGHRKSHLAQGHGLAAIRAGFTVYYRSIFDTVRDFLHDEALDGHERILQKYLKLDLLIIDDMGMKHLPKRSGEYLFEVIMRRHELRSTMMTSNRPLEEWGKPIGDVPAATAILDRFLQSVELIQIRGNSYRLAKSQKSSKDTKAPTGSAADEQ